MGKYRDEIIKQIKKNPENAADAFIKLQKEFTALKKDLKKIK